MRSKHNYGLLLCEVIHNNPKYNSYNPLENEPCEVSSVESNTHPIDRLVREGQSKCNTTVGSMSGSTNSAGTVGYSIPTIPSTISAHARPANSDSNSDEDETQMISTNSKVTKAKATKVLKYKKKQKNSHKYSIFIMYLYINDSFYLPAVYL